MKKPNKAAQKPKAQKADQQVQGQQSAPQDIQRQFQEQQARIAQQQAAGQAMFEQMRFQLPPLSGAEINIILRGLIKLPYEEMIGLHTGLKGFVEQEASRAFAEMQQQAQQAPNQSQKAPADGEAANDNVKNG